MSQALTLRDAAGSVTPAWRRPVPALVAMGAALGGAAVLQLPDLDRFSVVPIALVCLGSLALATAGVLLAAEPGQRPNAALFGLAALLFALEWAFTWPASPLPFVALPFGQLFAVALGVVLLRYPGTRLTRPDERWFVACTTIVTIVGRLLVEVTARPEWFAFGVSAGHGQLPASTLWWTIDANRSLSHAFAVATDIAQLLVLPIFVALILRRLRRESRVLRSELWPVVVSVLVLGGVLVTHLVALLVSAYRPASAPNEWISAVLSVAVFLIPLAFIVATVRIRMGRAAVADLVLRLREPSTSIDVQTALRRTVGDETLEVWYWLPDANEYVDVTGQVGRPDPLADRTVVEVASRNGERLAVVSADPALARRPGVLRAAVAATSLALENTRLEAELRAQLGEISASRTRIAEAALSERRRIERDLHDGIQQQLIALGATLGRLEFRENLPAADACLIEQARIQLRQTRHELRDLARGVHPAVLAESGLAAALTSVARGLPVMVHIDVPPARWPSNVELTAYFVVCEALTNCAKHAGASTAWVHGRDIDDVLIIAITDDGGGGAAITPGGGLAGLRDRVRALGGELTVSAAPHGGTSVQVTLPCA